MIRLWAAAVHFYFLYMRNFIKEKLIILAEYLFDNLHCHHYLLGQRRGTFFALYIKKIWTFLQFASFIMQKMFNHWIFITFLEKILIFQIKIFFPDIFKSISCDNITLISIPCILLRKSARSCTWLPGVWLKNHVTYPGVPRNMTVGEWFKMSSSMIIISCLIPNRIIKKYFLQSFYDKKFISK